LSEPEVSVVIPAWGAYAGAPLQEALASLREQDTPARIIVVDNASNEPLGAVGETEVVRAPERLTVGGARNLGLDHVTTPYVLFWDADDLMLPGTLSFLLEEISADETLVAVAAAIVEESGLRHRWPPRWSARLARHPTLFALAHSVWSLFPSTGATIMRTAQVRECGGYEVDEAAVSAEDWVLGASLAHRGRIGLRDRPGRVYRRLGESLWQDHRAPARQLAHADAVRNRVRTDAGIPRWARASALALKVLHPAVLLVLAPLARRVRSVRR
jgi:glycosyltransferase involved in cell wall biosynthesis